MTEDEIIEAAARIVCRRRGYTYRGEYGEYNVLRDYQSCSRRRKNGQSCGQMRVHWPRRAELPDPHACRFHLTAGEEEFLRAENEKSWREGLAAGLVPACWNWPAPEHCSFKDSAAAEEFLQWWNRLCAACGTGRELVLDHDHDTALIRGYLCKSCNSREPHWGDDSLIGRYRMRSPAIILGIYVRYAGWGAEAQPALPPPSAAELRAAVDRLHLPAPDEPGKAGA